MVERKVKLERTTAAALAEDLIKRGFIQGTVVKQEDAYYRQNAKGSEPARHQLRLRVSRELLSGTARSTLSYQSLAGEDGSRSREHLQTGVEDAVTTGAMLERMDFTLVATVKKTRRYYHADGVVARLDAVEGLGPFLELEALVLEPAQQTAGEERILALLEELGWKREDLIIPPYLELFLEKSGARE